MPGVALRPLLQFVGSHRDEIRQTVARRHRRSVSLFGSGARGDEGPTSDIDFLVELESGARPIEIVSIRVELEALFGRRVDVGTPESLRVHLRDEVLAEAIPL